MTDISKNKVFSSSASGEDLARAYLEQARRLRKKITLTEKQIAFLEARAAGLPSPSDQSAPRVQETRLPEAGYTRPLEEKNLQEQKLQAYRELLVKLTDQIHRVISDCIPEVNTESLVLEYCYVLGWTITDITSKLDYHRRTIERARNSGLRKIRLPQDAIWIEDVKQLSA